MTARNHYLLTFLILISTGSADSMHRVSRRVTLCISETPKKLQQLFIASKNWLHKAEEDLAAAKALILAQLFPSALYHCHQIAEKSLKGYLILKNEPNPKIHDLDNLLDLCIDFDQTFETLRPIIQHLNPFSTRYRYPSHHAAPSARAASTAVEKAQAVYAFVVEKHNQEP